MLTRTKLLVLTHRSILKDKKKKKKPLVRNLCPGLSNTQFYTLCLLRKLRGQSCRNDVEFWQRYYFHLNNIKIRETYQISKIIILGRWDEFLFSFHLFNYCIFPTILYEIKYVVILAKYKIARTSWNVITNDYTDVIKIDSRIILPPIFLFPMTRQVNIYKTLTIPSIPLTFEVCYDGTLSVTFEN